MFLYVKKTQTNIQGTVYGPDESAFNTNQLN